MSLKRSTALDSRLSGTNKCYNKEDFYTISTNYSYLCPTIDK